MIQINLLPVREERRKAGLRQLALMLGSAVIGSMLIVGALYWKQSSDLTSARNALAATQTEIDSYKVHLAKMEKLKATEARIRTKLDVIERLERDRLGPVRMLDELATHTPERVWLTRITTQGSQLSIEGKSLDNELVAGFLTALGDSPFFANVELQGTQSVKFEGLKLNEFRVTASLRSSDAGVQNTAASGFTPPAAAR